MKDPYPLVRVDWLDSNSRGSWASPEHAADPTQSLLCVSVGWLLRRDKKFLTVAGSGAYDGEGGFSQVNGSMTIPACAVVRVRRLR